MNRLQKEIDCSSVYWVNYFLDVCEKIQFRFVGIEPNPIELMRQVISRKVTLDCLEKNHDLWSSNLIATNKFHHLDDNELLPIRLAIMMSGIRKLHSDDEKKTIMEIEHMAEMIDWAFDKLGFDTSVYSTIWEEYRKSWQFMPGS